MVAPLHIDQLRCAQAWSVFFDASGRCGYMPDATHGLLEGQRTAGPAQLRRAVRVPRPRLPQLNQFSTAAH